MSLTKKQLASVGIISGKDAERFIDHMEWATTHKISKEERESMEHNYKAIMAKAKF